MIGNDPTPDCETRSDGPDPAMTNEPMLPTAFLALEGPGTIKNRFDKFDKIEKIN